MNSTFLIPYIVFSGDCRAALEFYKEVFAGEIISITTFEHSPIPVDKECINRIFDSEFKADGIHFKASDDLPDHSVKAGTNFSLFVSFTDKSERAEVFNKLSLHGHILFPLDDHFGMVKDKFGIQWMLTNAA